MHATDSARILFRVFSSCACIVYTIDYAVKVIENLNWAAHFYLYYY